MINPFQFYYILQKKFRFQSKLESSMLVLGGILLSIFELVSVMAIFPLMMIILDPVTAVHGRILGAAFRWTHLPSTELFAMVLAIFVIIIFSIKVCFQLFLWAYEYNLLSKWRIKISTTIFDAMMYSENQRLYNDSSSKLINMITSVIPYVVSNYIHPCINLVHTILMSSLILMYMVHVNIYLFMFTMVFGLTTILGFMIFQKNRIKSLGGKSQALSRKMLSTLQQAIAGYKESKIHQKEKYFTSQFKIISKETAKVDFSLLFTQNLPNILIEYISITVIFCAFIFLTFMKDNLQSSALQISMITILGMRMIPLINRSIISLALIRSSMEPIEQLLSMHNLLGIQNVPKENTQCSIHFENSLKLENISFKYKKKEPDVLKNISLEIKKGEHIGIVGASGAGKTTLINIVLGFLTNFRGRYLIDNQKIGKNNIYELRKLLSFVDQHPFILDGNFIENIAYGVKKEQVDINKIKEILNKVGLWEHVNSLGKKLYSPLGENGKFLSGGQRQRLAIARALYKNAKILILDEASSALDMESESLFIDFLETLRNEITIISIAHRLSTLKKCNKIIFIQDGSIVSQGSFRELYSSITMFKRYIDHTYIEVS